MKVITGNDLKTGLVVYLGVNGQWIGTLSEAKIFTDDDADSALVGAKERVREISDAYLIEVSEDALASGRQALHETIRSTGPTVRLDLGKQAGQNLGTV